MITNKTTRWNCALVGWRAHSPNKQTQTHTNSKPISRIMRAAADAGCCCWELVRAPSPDDTAFQLCACIYAVFCDLFHRTNIWLFAQPDASVRGAPHRCVHTTVDDGIKLLCITDYARPASLLRAPFTNERIEQ